MGLSKRRRRKENKKRIAAGVMGLITGTAITYFLYGTASGKKKRKEVRSQVSKAKKEIMSRVERAEDITEEKYHEIVDTIVEKYKNIKNIDKSEIEEMADDMRGHWKNIKKQIKKGKK